MAMYILLLSVMSVLAMRLPLCILVMNPGMIWLPWKVFRNGLAMRLASARSSFSSLFCWTFHLHGGSTESAHSLQNVCLYTAGRMCIAADMQHVKWMIAQSAYFPTLLDTMVLSRM